jgi:hypothetical protein
VDDSKIGFIAEWRLYEVNSSSLHEDEPQARLACSVAWREICFSLDACPRSTRRHPSPVWSIQEHAAVGELRRAIQKCHRGVKSRPPNADFCAQLRGAPRSNPAQQRHAKGETVSRAGFIALLCAKAPKLNGLAERCTTMRAKDVLAETA